MPVQSLKVLVEVLVELLFELPGALLITELPSWPTVPVVPELETAPDAEAPYGEALCEVPPDVPPPNGEALVCASKGVPERSSAVHAEAIPIKRIGFSSFR